MVISCFGASYDDVKQKIATEVAKVSYSVIMEENGIQTDLTKTHVETCSIMLADYEREGGITREQSVKLLRNVISFYFRADMRKITELSNIYIEMASLKIRLGELTNETLK
jgi:hypothetical protein